jgi:hypothetical protein
VSLLTKSQASRAKGKARARAGAAAKAGAQRRARRAAAQARPLTASARTAARQGIHHARSWAAPRLDRTGHSLEERVAPKVAAMLSAAARRIEPVPPRRRRWPVLAAGLVTAAGLSATAAYLLKRRATAKAPQFSAPADAAGTTMPTEAPSHLAASDANGRVRTG